MANLQLRGRRDVLWLLGASLCVLVPIALVVRSRERKIGVKASGSKTGAAKTKAKPSIAENPTTIALSPGGNHLAGVVSKNLVVWNTSTRRELARFAINEGAGDALVWSGDNIITNSGAFAQSWDVSRQLAISAPIDEDGSRHPSDVEAHDSRIDALRDLKTRVKNDGTFGAFRASTGQPFPLKAPAKLKLQAMTGDNWIVLPGPTRGPLVVICSMAEVLPATAFPTPAPTATASPQTKHWQDEKTALLDELSDLHNEMRSTCILNGRYRCATEKLPFVSMTRQNRGKNSHDYLFPCANELWERPSLRELETVGSSALMEGVISDAGASLLVTLNGLRLERAAPNA